MNVRFIYLLNYKNKYSRGPLPSNVIIFIILLHEHIILGGECLMDGIHRIWHNRMFVSMIMTVFYCMRSGNGHLVII